MMLAFTVVAKNDAEAELAWQTLFWGVYDIEFLRRYSSKVVVEDEVGPLHG